MHTAVALWSVAVLAQPFVEEHGATAADLFRELGFAAGAAGIILLLTLQFVVRHRISRASYHWFLLIGLFFIPATVLSSATFFMMEDSKEVRACSSCHVMHPFVNDLRDPKSDTLASRHFRNKWIPEQQCYSCHTTYGFQGTMRSKLGGLRHWLLYTTNSWEKPIKIHRAYSNGNCLFCHGNTPKYEEVEVHTIGAAEIASDEVSCISCHGAPHPDAEHRGDS